MLFLSYINHLWNKLLKLLWKTVCDSNAYYCCFLIPFCGYHFYMCIKVSCLYYSRHSPLKHRGSLLAREHYDLDNEGIITLILNFCYLKSCSIPWTGCTLGLFSSAIAILTLKVFLYAWHPNGQPRELNSEDILFILLIILRTTQFSKDLKTPYLKTFVRTFLEYS